MMLAPPSVVGVPRPYVCAVPGCGKDYVYQHALYQHYMDKHELRTGRAAQPKAVELNEVVEAGAAVRRAGAAVQRVILVAAASEAPAPLRTCLRLRRRRRAN